MKTLKEILGQYSTYMLITSPNPWKAVAPLGIVPWTPELKQSISPRIVLWPIASFKAKSKTSTQSQCDRILNIIWTNYSTLNSGTELDTCCAASEHMVLCLHWDSAVKMKDSPKQSSIVKNFHFFFVTLKIFSLCCQKQKFKRQEKVVLKPIMRRLFYVSW